MSKQLRRKKRILTAAGLLCLILLGAFLMVMQTKLSVIHQMENTRENIEQIQALVDEAQETAKQNENSYDEVYFSKVDTIAYMAKKDSRFVISDAWMRTLAKKMDLTNIVILDREGNVEAATSEPKGDFTRSRFEQLRTVFDSSNERSAFEVEYDDTVRRYYSARIDASREVVIEQDPSELHQILYDINSWESMLSNVKVGLNGYTFAVSSQDYTVLYHPDKSREGIDSINSGLEVEKLQDSFYGWMTLDGERLYCGVKNLDEYHAYVICAVPASEMAASRNITVGIVLFIFFVVLAVVIAYAVLIMQDQEQGGEMEGAAVYERLPAGTRYNEILGKKIFTVSLLGLAFIFVVSFYMQTLFSLSLRSISNERQVNDVAAAIEQNDRDLELLTEQYNHRYLNKCEVAADIMSANPQLQNEDELETLSRILNVEFIMLFDKNGNETLSNSTYVNFRISENPDDQSYAFRKLLQGAESVVQEPGPDEISGAYHQYMGSLMYDADGRADGFLQISIGAEKFRESLAATELSVVLDGVKASAGGFAFAIDKETKTFSAYPEEHAPGKSAESYGVTESQMRGGFSDYITLSGRKYYAASIETDTDYVYVVVPESRINSGRLVVAVVSTIASALLLMVMFVLITLSHQTKTEENDAADEAAASGGPMVGVKMPDGNVKMTESAASRWANAGIHWEDQTPEQQIAMLLKGLMSLFAAAICICVLFKDRFLSDDSIFRYIISGEWERGINVFSITGSIMIICVATVLVMIMREFLRMIIRTVGARGETICRMIRSLLKYVIYIAMLYYCFALFGVDTKTLLASAGILSLIIGLGARSLVSDILAGLFIIFEGEFRVGDIVTVGDWRGTVQEIGVRTTKIMDAGQNVKIISNSNMTGIINMTRKNSYTFCDVGIEYGESLERVESILSKELPKIKNRLSAIKDGPFYKGVVSLGDNSVNLRIMAQCAESDRAQLGRDLNREMKILFDKYDINIPFPQVVVNQPREYEKATEWEKRRADAFNESQKKLTKELEQDENEKQ